MNPLVLYCTIDLWHIKTCILWPGSSKKQYFLNFSTFHTPCGHQIVVMSTKKGGHMNPMVPYCTIDFWHIKHTNFFSFLPLKIYVLNSCERIFASNPIKFAS